MKMDSDAFIPDLPEELSWADGISNLEGQEFITGRVIFLNILIQGGRNE